MWYSMSMINRLIACVSSVYGGFTQDAIGFDLMIYLAYNARKI